MIRDWILNRWPALAKGDMVDNPVAVKESAQINDAVTATLAAVAGLAIALGLLPQDTDIDHVVMVGSSIWVFLSTVYSMVARVVSTTKLGLDPNK